MTPEPEKLAVSLGQRLNALRKKTGLKQSAFAHLMGISDDTICSIERGRKLARIETLCAIAERLQMTLRQLLDFQDEPKTKPTINQQLTAFNLYLKTKTPRQIKAGIKVFKHFLDQAQAIYKKPRRRKPG